MCPFEANNGIQRYIKIIVGLKIGVNTERDQKFYDIFLFCIILAVVDPTRNTKYYAKALLQSTLNVTLYYHNCLWHALNF